MSAPFEQPARRPRRPGWAPPGPDKPRWHARPELDLAPAEVCQVLVVATAPRSASNFFDSALTATGRAGRAEEYAAPWELVQSHRCTGTPRLSRRGRVDRIRARLRGEAQWEHMGRFDPGSVAEHFRCLARRRSTPNGVFAIKVFPPHLTGVLDAYGLDVDLWDVPVRWVRLRRRDRLAQAVSMAIASQSGQWRPDRPARADPVLDVDQVARLVDWFEDLDAQWDRRLAGCTDPVLHVLTEDVVADPAPAVAATLALLGEAGPAVSPPVLGDGADAGPGSTSGSGPADGRAPGPVGPGKVPAGEVAPAGSTPSVDDHRSPAAALRAEWVARVAEARPDLAARRWTVSP